MEVAADGRRRLVLRGRPSRCARAAAVAGSRSGPTTTPPYRVFHDVSGLAAGTTVAYRAIVLDNARHSRRSARAAGTVPAPALTWDAPVAGSKQRGTGAAAAVRRPRARDPRRRVRAQRGGRPVDGGRDGPLVARLRAARRPHRAGRGTSVAYRATLTEPDGTRGDERGADDRGGRRRSADSGRCTTSARHGDERYGQWGLHIWGERGRPGRCWADRAGTSRRSARGVEDGWARYEVAAGGRHPAGELHHAPAVGRHRADDARAGRRSLVVPLDDTECGWAGDPRLRGVSRPAPTG